MEEIAVQLETVTPVFGGAAVPGGPRAEADAAFRAPEVAAQIRHWWRVLEAPAAGSPGELYAREVEIFGGVHGATRRSAVEVLVDTIRPIALDRQEPPGSDVYALWPARGNPQWLPRWRPGCKLRVRLRVPSALRSSLERAVKAWAVFGGYGGRTRRGCGSLVPLPPEQAAWLPAGATREALAVALNAPELWGAPAAARSIPSLSGARVAVGQPTRDALAAWRQAVGWLRDFRQKPGPTADDARFPGANGRPGRSRWPEPDKIRRLGAHADRHTPFNEHGQAPAWPRSAFGLPIAFSAWDPHLKLTWRRGQQMFQRLASPLIVKPLALADGTFVPMALWLNREDPPGGEVVLTRTNQSRVVTGSATAFGLVRAAGDPAAGTLPFSPLRTATSVRDAFLDWVCRHGGAMLP